MKVRHSQEAVDQLSGICVVSSRHLSDFSVQLSDLCVGIQQLPVHCVDPVQIVAGDGCHLVKVVRQLFYYLYNCKFRTHNIFIFYQSRKDVSMDVAENLLKSVIAKDKIENASKVLES